MRFQTEVWERYADSQNRAKRALRKATATGTDMKLPVLNDILDRNKLAYTVELGIVEIPVSQIVGIGIDTDRDIYTRDFRPLPSVQSEFAEEWTEIYKQHTT